MYSKYPIYVSADKVSCNFISISKNDASAVDYDQLDEEWNIYLFIYL